MRRTEATDPVTADDERPVPEPVEPVELDAAELEELDQEPVGLVGVPLFTIPRSKAFPGVDQDYVSELLNGMLETGVTALRISRDRPLPYFGFLNHKPLRSSYDGIVAYLGHLIGIAPERLAWGAEGVVRATAGDEMVLMELIFGVEVGPRCAWVRFTRDLETRVFRRHLDPDQE